MSDNPYRRIWVNDEMRRLYETCEPLEVTGARFRLELRAIKNEGRVTADDVTLARQLGVSVEAWNAMRDMVVAGWERVGDDYVIPAVVTDIEAKANDSKRAKNAADARWAKHRQCPGNARGDAQAYARAHAQADAQAMPEEMPLLSSLSSEDLREEPEMLKQCSGNAQASGGPKTPPASPSGSSGSDHAVGEAGDTNRRGGQPPSAKGSPRTRTLPPQPAPVVPADFDDDWLQRLDRSRARLHRIDAKRATRADRQIKAALGRRGEFRGIPVPAIKLGLEQALKSIVGDPKGVASWEGCVRSVVLREGQSAAAAAQAKAAADATPSPREARNGLENLGAQLTKIGGAK